MSVYSYTLHRKKYYFYRCSIGGQQFSRRFDADGNRFISFKDAEVGEALFLQSKLNVEKSNKDYFIRFYDDFYLFLQSKYKQTTLYPVVKSFNKYIYQFVRNERICEIDSDLFIKINDFINSLNFPNKKPIVSAAKNLILFLRRFNVFVNVDVITLDRKFNVEQIKLRQFWTLAEFTSFIKVVDSVYWKLLFSVLFYYGLRISEVRVSHLQNRQLL